MRDLHVKYFWRYKKNEHFKIMTKSLQLTYTVVFEALYWITLAVTGKPNTLKYIEEYHNIIDFICNKRCHQNKGETKWSSLKVSVHCLQHWCYKIYITTQRWLVVLFSTWQHYQCCKSQVGILTSGYIWYFLLRDLLSTIQRLYYWNI